MVAIETFANTSTYGNIVFVRSSSNSTKIPDGSNLGEYYQIL
jgi:hypothetical protein